MNLLDLCDLEAPDRVDVVGKRMAGALDVRYARASDLAPTIRFGASRFSTGTNLVEINGTELDVAGLTLFESADGWRVAHRGGYNLRRTQVENWADGSNVSDKARTALCEWAVVTATRLAEQFPDAFTRFGFADEYSDAAQLDAYVKEQQENTAIVVAYATLANGVADGRYTVQARTVEAPARLRWKTPRLHQSSLPMTGQQPGVVAGEVLDDGLLVGYAVDRREYQYGDPDCHAGPLFIPLAHCWAAEQDGKVQRWAP